MVDRKGISRPLHSNTLSLVSSGKAALRRSTNPVCQQKFGAVLHPLSTYSSQASECRSFLHQVRKCSTFHTLFAKVLSVTIESLGSRRIGCYAILTSQGQNISCRILLYHQ